MPVIKKQEEQFNDLPRPVNEPEFSVSVDTSRVVSDFLATENGLFNAAEGLNGLLSNQFPEDPNYHFSDDIEGYEGYVNYLEGARSAEHMQHLKNKIDKENRRKETFAAADGWQKAAAIGALVATDPLSLVPIGGVAYKTYRSSGRILDGAARTAGVASATETVNETLIQLNQETRTTEEGLLNIGAATVMGGLLGGAASTLSKSEIEDLTINFERQMTVPTDSELSTVGAAQRGTTLRDEEIEGIQTLRNVYSKMPGFLKNPVLDGAISPSNEVRVITEKLADLSLVKNKNADAVANEASVELQVKGYDALRYNFYTAEKDLYNKYLKRAKQGLPSEQRIGSKKNGLLSRQEFNEQAYIAGINGDAHIIPEIAEYAKITRANVFDPMKNRMQEVGLLDEDLGEVITADSYMPRMFNREEIVNRRNDFKEIVLEDLRAKRQEQIDRLGNFDEVQEIVDGIEAANAKIKEIRKTKDKGKNAEITALKAEIDELTARLPDNPSEVKKLLKEARATNLKANRLDEELDDIAEQLIDRITNSTSGRLPYDLRIEGKNKGPQKVGARGAAKGRVWTIRDDKVKDFVVKDIRAIVESHIRTMAPDAEIMAKFGTLDIDPLKKAVQEDFNRLRGGRVKDKKTGESRKLNNKELAKLDKQLTRDINNITAMHEKLRGTFAQPDDYSAPQYVLERFALGWNFVRLLGDVVASSMPDIMRPVMVHGIERTYGKLFKTLISDVKGLKMASKDAEEMGLALDITTAMTTLRRMNMDEHVPATGRIDDFTNKVTSFGALAFGMNHWTAMMKTFTGVMTQNRMIDGIIGLSQGKDIGIKEIKNLASHGIDPDMAARIAKQFKKHGEKRQVLNVPNAREWDDAQARNLFRAAVRKQVDEIIVTPGLDRSLWMSRPGWRTIGQFKSFSFASNQRVLMAGLQQGDANYFMGLASMIMVGSLVYAYKTWSAGKEISDDPRKWIIEGIDRSGVTGIGMDVNNIVEKMTGGNIGINAFAGGEPMSRYASRNLAGTLLGPSFGMAQDIFGTTAAIGRGEFAPSDVHAMRRLMPLQNAPITRGIFDEIEEGMKRNFAVEQ